MNIWAVTNMNVGTGKTTAAVSLAGEMVSVGASTLLVDADSRCSLTNYFQPETKPGSDIRALFEAALANEQLSCEDLIVNTGIEQLDVLPGNSSLSELQDSLLGVKGAGRILSNALATLSGKYENVLIECPDDFSVLAVNSLAASQFLVVALVAADWSAEDDIQILKLAERVGRSREQQLPFLIVPTRHDAANEDAEFALNALREKYKDQVWGAFVPEDSEFDEAQAAKKPLPLLNPKTRGAVAYRQLFNALEAK